MRVLRGRTAPAPETSSHALKRCPRTRRLQDLGSARAHFHRMVKNFSNGQGRLVPVILLCRDERLPHFDGSAEVHPSSAMRAHVCAVMTDCPILTGRQKCYPASAMRAHVCAVMTECPILTGRQKCILRPQCEHTSLVAPLGTWSLVQCYGGGASLSGRSSNLDWFLKFKFY